MQVPLSGSVLARPQLEWHVLSTGGIVRWRIRSALPLASEFWRSSRLFSITGRLEEGCDGAAIGARHGAALPARKAWLS